MTKTEHIRQLFSSDENMKFLPDTEIARTVGCSRNLVRRVRAVQGMQTTTRLTTRRGKRIWVNVAPLGGHGDLAALSNIHKLAGRMLLSYENLEKAKESTRRLFASLHEIIEEERAELRDERT